MELLPAPDNIIWYHKTKNQYEIFCMTKKMRGRPAVDTEAVNLRLSRALIEVVDEQRKKESDLPTRPAMIRRMLKQWCQGRGIDVDD